MLFTKHLETGASPCCSLKLNWSLGQQFFYSWRALWCCDNSVLTVHCAMQVIASTDPKPVPGDWSGNGAPVKFSTRETREEGKGWFVIQEHLRRLQNVSTPSQVPPESSRSLPMSCHHMPYAAPYRGPTASCYLTPAWSLSITRLALQLSCNGS